MDDGAASRTREDGATDGRGGAAAALALACLGILLVAGCTELTSQGPTTLEATPVEADPGTAGDLGYVEARSDARTSTWNASAADGEETVTATSHVREYHRRGPGGDLEASVGVLSTPETKARGGARNPVDDWGPAEALRNVSNPYGDLEDLEGLGTRTVTILGEPTRVTRFAGVGVDGHDVRELTLHLVRTTAGSDIVFAVAIHPRDVPAEAVGVDAMLGSLAAVADGDAGHGKPSPGAQRDGPDSGTFREVPPRIEFASEAYLDDKVLVGFREDMSGLRGVAQVAKHHGATVNRTDPRLDFAALTVPAPNRDALVADLRDLPQVAYAQPDMKVETFQSYVPNDPRYEEDQWGPAAVGLEEAWSVTLGSHDREVAILDTGVALDHPDLAPNICSTGHDYGDGDDEPYDDRSGHGTHVAGTVAAVIDNGEGVAGVTDSCVRPIRVFGPEAEGFGTVASGIVDAVENGSDVVSMSLGGPPDENPGGPVLDAIEHASSQDVLVVAAAGNEGCEPLSYPAAYPQVVAVGSLDDDGSQRSSFSQCGEGLELVAPGRDILSTAPTDGHQSITEPSGYTYLRGTSMAAPHVSGAAALVWSQNPTLDADEVRCVLRNTADDLGSPGHDPETGFGRLDVAEAISVPGDSTSCNALWPALPTPASACELPCLEDFDDGTADHFTLEGLWSVDESCGTPPTPPRYLGSHHHGSCNYEGTNQRRDEATINLDLRDVEVAEIRLYDHFDLSSSDFGGAMYRPSAYHPWEFLGYVSGSLNVDQSGWKENVIGVRSEGEIAQLRLYFRPEDSGNDRDGWLVDDLQVRGATFCEPDCHENFDDGEAEHMIPGGFWHISSACDEPPSMPNYMGYNRDSDCTYEGAKDKWGTDVVLHADLRDAPSATLSFQHRLEREYHGPESASFVQVRPWGNSNWMGLESWPDDASIDWTEESIEIPETMEGVLGELPDTSGDPGEGQAANQILGRRVEIRWVFQPGADSYSTGDVGWLLDDIRIETQTLLDRICQAPCEVVLDPPVEELRLEEGWRISAACGGGAVGDHHLGFHPQEGCVHRRVPGGGSSATLPVDLEAVSAADLVFRYRHDRADAATRDRLTVEVRPAAGDGWEVLGSYGGSTTDEWTGETLDLDGYAGQSVEVRWRYEDLGGDAGDNVGWMVDGLRVDGS